MSKFLEVYVFDLLRRVEALAAEPLPPLGSDAAVYVRISDDAEGERVGVTNQTEDSLKRAAHEGHTIPPEGVFEDNDTSASTASRKPRPDFERLLAYVVQGQIKRVYAYSNSRLTRRPMELEILIQAHRQYGVEFRTVVSGDDDLSTADGRMVARFKAAADAGEAERTAERVTRRIKGKRDQGISSTGGIRPFGYAQGDRTKLADAEADGIREGADILLKGGTLGDVLRAWEAAGLRPVRAKQWHRRTIQGIYQSPRIAGLYLHEGVLRESLNVPAIIDRKTWDAVQERLRPSEPFDAAHWRKRNLLSDVLQCGNCGHRMNAKGPHYGCLKAYGGCGSNFRKREWLENLIDDLMTARLESMPKGNRETGRELVDNSAEISRLEGLIEQTKAALTDGLIDAGDAFPMIGEYRAKVTGLRKEEAASVKAAAQTVAPEDALSLWKSDDLDARRRVLRDEVRLIVVHKIGRGYGQHKPLPDDSVDVLWT